MPIYEYICLDCNEPFEDLIRNKADEEALECPGCKSKRLARRMSTFGVQGAVSRPITAGTKNCAGCTSHNCAGCR